MRRRSHIIGEANITLKEDVYTEKWKQLLACLAVPLAAGGAVGVAEPEGHESLRRPV